MSDRQVLIIKIKGMHGQTREGRPTTTIYSHILHIFLSETPQNPCPSNNIFLMSNPYK